MDATIVVGTYGSRKWIELAQERAIPSALSFDVPVIHTHSGTLDTARNLGLCDVRTPWVCFLDADDELEPGYFDAMADAPRGEVRAPAVRYVTNGRPGRARMPRVAGHHHDCSAECLKDGNWLVVGAVARTSIVREVGGWRDFPWSEDWDLWLRCWRAGATIERVPSAVYRAHVRRDSRNRAPERGFKVAVHNAIAHANGLPAVPA